MKEGKSSFLINCKVFDHWIFEVFPL